MGSHARPRRPLWERIATVLSVAAAVVLLVGFAALLVTQPAVLDARWVRPSTLDPVDPPRRPYGTTPLTEETP